MPLEFWTGRAIIGISIANPIGHERSVQHKLGVIVTNQSMTLIS
jgi:hypothetical protein